MPTYHYPETINEACSLMGSADHPMVYGGGTAVQILIKQGVLFASDLIDIGGIDGLAELSRTSAGLRAGPLVTLRQMETSPLVRAMAPLAAEVYRHVANPRVRNTASIGGNIAHGDYRLDPPTALMVLDARIEVASATGKRTVAARDFFVDFQQTALEQGEIITAIEIPRQPESAGAHFAKFSSLAVNDWPCASAAALIVDKSRRRREVRLGLGALSHVPVFLSFDIPDGTEVDDVVAAAREAAEPLIDPIPDVRGTSTYKKRLGLVAIAEAVQLSWKEQQDERRFSLLNWRRGR